MLPLLVFCLCVTLWAAGGGCVSPNEGGFLQGTVGTAPTNSITHALQSFDQGDSGGAASYLNQAVREAGDTSMAAVAVADELRRVGRPSQAAQFLQTWNTKRPETTWDPMLWVSLGRAQRSAGVNDAAALAEKEATTRAAEIMKEIGRLSPARQPLIPSQSQTQTQSVVTKLMRAADFYGTDGPDFSFDKTLTALREAKRLMPDDPEVINQLGYTLADKGTTPAELKEALELTKLAAQKAPNNGVILDSYGWALFKKSDFPGARRVLRQAADATPDEPEIRYHLGVVYAELGLKKDALLEYERALRLRPDFAPAQTERARLMGLPGINPL